MSNFKRLRNLYAFLTDELGLEPKKHEVSDMIGYASLNDFHVELDNTEWRIIDSAWIDEIATEEIKEIVTDCYLNGTDLDKYWWIEVDWKKTAKNCIDADGYGHHFASYDHEEYYFDEGWYFFRTN